MRRGMTEAMKSSMEFVLRDHQLLPQMTLAKGKVGPATFVHLEKKNRDFRDFNIIHK
jgi:hypothetical protein